MSLLLREHARPSRSDPGRADQPATGLASTDTLLAGLTLSAEAFERLPETDAEALLAARYCMLSEAGYPPASALALATRTEIDLCNASAFLGKAPRQTRRATPATTRR